MPISLRPTGVVPSVQGDGYDRGLERVSSPDHSLESQNGPNSWSFVARYVLLCCQRSDGIC